MVSVQRHVPVVLGLWLESKQLPGARLFVKNGVHEAHCWLWGCRTSAQCGLHKVCSHVLKQVAWPSSKRAGRGCPSAMWEGAAVVRGQRRQCIVPL